IILKHETLIGDRIGCMNHLCGNAIPVDFPGIFSLGAGANNRMMLLALLIADCSFAHCHLVYYL
ncbi:MAG: hypothetical protein ABIN04_03140, partial [Ginsengibacter sp.]